MKFLMYTIVITLVMHFVYKKTLPVLLKGEDEVNKELLYRFDEHAFFYSFAAGLITAILSAFIMSVVSVTTENYNNKIRIFLVLIIYFTACTLIFLRLKSGSEKYVKGRRELAIEKDRKNKQKKKSENINLSSQVDLTPEDYQYARLGNEYQRDLHEQLMNSLDEELNHQASNNYNDNPIIANSQYGSSEFVGIDGNPYTKDEYGYLRRKEETEIIGQNGYDKDGNRIRYY